MAGGALTNRPAASTSGEKNVNSIAFDVLQEGIFSQWATSDEFSKRLVLGQSISGKPIKGLTQKPLKVQRGGYDFRVRINQGLGGIIHGRANDSTSIASATGQYYDYAIYRPYLYQGVFQLGMQEMAQLDGDGVEAMDRNFDLMDDVSRIAMQSHWEDLEKDFLGYGFQDEAEGSAATTTSGVLSFQGLAHMLDNAAKSGLTGNENMYGYIDVTDAAYASWKAYVRSCTGGLVTETELYNVLRGCTFGNNKPTAWYCGEIVGMYIWALSVDKVRFINVDASNLELASSGVTFCGIPVVPIKTFNLSIFSGAAATTKYFKTVDTTVASGTSVTDTDEKVQQGAMAINENTLKLRAWRMLADKNGGPKPMAPLDMEAKLGVIKKYAHLLAFGTTVRKFNGILQGITGTGA